MAWVWCRFEEAESEANGMTASFEFDRCAGDDPRLFVRVKPCSEVLGRTSVRYVKGLAGNPRGLKKHRTLVCGELATILPVLYVALIQIDITK
jgi:hypothetical protein